MKPLPREFAHPGEEMTPDPRKQKILTEFGWPNQEAFDEWREEERHRRDVALGNPDPFEPE